MKCLVNVWSNPAGIERMELMSGWRGFAPSPPAPPPGGRARGAPGLVARGRVPTAGRGPASATAPRCSATYKSQFENIPIHTVRRNFTLFSSTSRASKGRWNCRSGCSVVKGTVKDSSGPEQQIGFPQLALLAGGAGRLHWRVIYTSVSVSKGKSYYYKPKKGKPWL